MEIERLRQLLNYDPETGALTWKERAEVRPQWNGRYAGKPAGCVDSHGYLKIGIDGRNYYAHRLAWAIHHGEWPQHQIDHINGDKLDNRIANLRDVPQVVNGRNQKMAAHNTSGYAGIHWRKSDRRWQAFIKVDRKQRHLGYFDNLADAVAVRRAAERQYGFTERHGRAQM